MTLKIISWNVNSIKTLSNWLPWADKSRYPTFTHLLDSFSADIICMQEIKSTKSKLDAEFHTLPGYWAFYALHPTEGYSGVATFVRRSICPALAEEGFTGLLNPSEPGIGGTQDLLKLFSRSELLDLDSQGRCVITDHGLFVLLNVYFPATSDSAERELFKMKFSLGIQARVQGLIAIGRKVIVAGDVNVCHREIDHFDPEGSKKEWGILSFDGAPIRRWFTDWLGSCSLVDTFRFFHPLARDVYTVWNTRENRRPMNQGTRIDYVLCTSDLQDWLVDSQVDMSVMGSDHCPIHVLLHTVHPTSGASWTEFQPKVVKPPLLCTYHWKSYGERQKSLDAFLVKKQPFEFNASSETAFSLSTRCTVSQPAPSTTVSNTLSIKKSVSYSAAKKPASSASVSKKSKLSQTKSLPGPKQGTLRSFFKKPPLPVESEAKQD
ncbi:Class II abasic (AP) endonuclease [Kappamyces sp. JEL0829]|nr:Class II abasic (AP) endonuclease [Kappamyces sp. JEL0829]